MPPLKPPRRTAVRGVVAATIVALAALVLPSLPAANASGPTDASRIYRWGNAKWNDEFIGKLRSMWTVNHPSMVRNQNGMLTMIADNKSRSVTVTLKNHNERYGRWEARVRANQITSGHTPYRITWELIPTTSYSCGARNIEVGTYKWGESRAHVGIRRGHTAFVASKARNLHAGPFHTYAVEVTKTHIAWFVDAHVVMLEKRKDARTGAVYKVRFKLQAVPHRTMNATRMQMDWVRYHTLARPNARSIAAPAAHKVTNTAVCR